MNAAQRQVLSVAFLIVGVVAVLFALLLFVVHMSGGHASDETFVKALVVGFVAFVAGFFIRAGGTS